MQGARDIQRRNAVDTGVHSSEEAFEILDRVTSSDIALPKEGSDGTVFVRRKMLFIYPSNLSMINYLMPIRF